MVYVTHLLRFFRDFGDGLWHCFNHITLWQTNITMENHHFQWVKNPLNIIFNSYFDVTRGYP